MEIRGAFCPPTMNITWNLGNRVFPVHVSCSLSDEIWKLTLVFQLYRVSYYEVLHWAELHWSCACCPGSPVSSEQLVGAMWYPGGVRKEGQQGCTKQCYPLDSLQWALVRALAGPCVLLALPCSALCMMLLAAGWAAPGLCSIGGSAWAGKLTCDICRNSSQAPACTIESWLLHEERAQLLVPLKELLLLAFSDEAGNCVPRGMQISQRSKYKFWF